MPFPSDLHIAQSATLAPLSDIAASLGLQAEHLEPYGRDVAKIDLDALGDV
ncbi:MAG: formate--tetrahydrofolate ligase, partial [Acidimicrobiaceae bacterium]